MLFKKLGTCWLTMLFIVGCCSFAQAQQKRNPFANNIIGTLTNPKMARELNLVDEQKEVLKNLVEEFNQIRREIGEDMRPRWENASDSERKEIGKEYRARIEEGRLGVVRDMKDTLLPEQIERLEQLSAQRMMNEGKGRESAGLLSDQMVNYLDISDRQKERIEEKSKALREEVTKKIQQILEEAKQELLEELDRDQKEKYEQLIGDPLSDEDEDGEDEPRSRRGAESRSGRR